MLRYNYVSPSNPTNILICSTLFMDIIKLLSLIWLMQTSHVTDALDMYFNLSLILTHRKAEENVKVDYKDHRRSTHFELKLSKI